MNVVDSPYLLDQLLGLEYYITPTPFINGIVEFRSRYEDFVVIEVVDQGVKVTNLKYSKKYRLLEHYVKYRRNAIYLLCKKGLSTHEAVRLFAKRLGIGTSNIKYLGLKDTNAITCQLIIIDRIPYMLPGIVSIDDKVKALLLGCTEKKPKLWGNHFIITLRVDLSQENAIDDALEYLANNPYIPSYYGYQRFGTRRPITHIIGELLLRGDWCEALNYIIGYPFAFESSNAIYARLCYDKRELTEALRIFSERTNLDLEERLLNTYMSKNSETCLQLLKHIPRRLLLLYISAYQSYVFNRLLSIYLKSEEFSKLKKMKITVKPGIYNIYDITDFKVDRPTSIRLLGLHTGSLKRKALTRVYGLSWTKTYSKDRVAYKITFSLRKGMYATVLLREILKTDPLVLTG